MPYMNCGVFLSKHVKNRLGNISLKQEKVSIGHGCPRQNAIQKKVTYVIVTGTA